jgi:hypothetical protein
MKWWITPSLALTDDDLEAMDVDEATTLIQAGDEAYVATPTEAYTVLHQFGLSDDEIANKVDFALGLL